MHLTVTGRRDPARPSPATGHSPTGTRCPNSIVAECLFDRLIDTSRQVFMSGPSYRLTKRRGAPSPLRAVQVKDRRRIVSSCEFSLRYGEIALSTIGQSSSDEPLLGDGASVITSRHAASAASLSSLESGVPKESNAARTASTGVCSTGISSVKLLAVGTGTYSMGSHVQYASPFSVPPPLSARNVPSSSEWADSLRKSGT